MSDFDSEETLWPQAGDDPFAVAHNSRLVARVNFTFEEPWGGYAEGFKRLADLGVAHIEQTGHSHDYLVYPVIFGYRHFTELSLKGIISNATRLLDKPVVIPNTHNLAVLWDSAEALLNELELADPTTFRDVRECLARFVAPDATSEAFRYPVKRNGDATLPSELKDFDLGKVRDVVTRLGTFVDAVATHASVMLDYKDEIASAYDRGWL